MASLGFDTSSYPSAQVAPQDPLAQIGKVLQIQGAQQGLLQQQQEYKFRQAIGPILQQAIDPKTGEIDTGKATVLGLGHPDTAWGMPAFVTQMITNGHMKADTALKEMQVAKDQWAMTTGVAQGLVTKAIENAANKGHIDPTSGKWVAAAPTLTHGEIANGLSDLVAAGGMDSKDAAAFLTRNATSSPEQNFQMTDRIMKSGQNIDQGLARITGAIKANNLGGRTTFTQEVPATGQVNQIGNLTHRPTAEQMNAGQPGVNAQSQPIVRPAAQARPFVDADGNPIPRTGPQGSGAPGAPAANVTGLSPQETKLQEDRAKGAVEYENELTTVNTVGQENLRVLREMQDAMKEFKAGGGMEVRQRLAQLAQGLGMPNRLVDELAGGNRGALAEFQKLAVRYATQEMKTNMGSGQRFTNLDFSTFLKNNPTIDTDPRGLDKMFKFLEQGVWRSGQQQEAHQQWKSGWRPKGFENSGIDSFPVWWTKILSDVNKKSP